MTAGGEPAAELRAPTPQRATLRGWGGGPGAGGWLVRADRAESVAAALRLFRRHGSDSEPWRGVLARGMGRSYGDAAQLSGGLVLETGALKGFELDANSGVVTAGAGVTIGELLEQLVPVGWIVPVVPGTQHVSVGGAVAADIHGKNHGTAGTFGSHVEAIGLMSSAGHELSLGPHDALFQATLGGMGLTGVILWARIRLAPVSSPFLSVDSDRVGDLDEALAALSEPGGPHRVAWLDLLGRRPGRGVVTRAAHLPGDRAPVSAGMLGGATVAARATVPAGWPRGLLRPASVRAFNELRLRRTPARERERIEPIGPHMFPLDALDAWPRLYGRAGFLQYQLVVPFGSEHVLEQVIAELRRARVPCYLAVLKDLGESNGAPLSFPLAGWTLALDLPRAAPGIGPALDRCDELVAQAGGRVYLSKDARLRPDALRAMYPRLEEWRVVRDGADPDRVWRSDLADRTGLLGDSPGAGVGAWPSASGSDGGSGAERRVLLLGGTSEIGLAIVRRMASEGPVRPFLVGRDRDGLARAAASLEQSGIARVDHEVLDADDLDAHEQVIAAAFERAGGVDVAVLAVGVLGAQAGLDADRDDAARVMRVNFVGAGSLMLAALRRLREQGHGTLVVLSSVASERPRASNPVYGAAKAGVDALAQGLSDALAGSGVRVLVVRPGFVRTRMTQGLPSPPFATTPEAVADATVRALTGSAHTIWVPKVVRYVFAVLRHLPRPIYRRLPL
ncbi:MAG TPA: SDR family NAD(P)-dependent oxidoreductase [Solirubrobacteraceae bacterium]|nr:SDR family NAD(P)-dependent oxidoreductase [Solirubrobacteraceae bacterium]